MKRTCTPHPKIFLHIRLLQTWEVRLEDLGALTPYCPYKERTYIHGILVSSIPLYNHQTASSSRYVEFPNSQTFRVVGNHLVTDLTFRGSLVGTPPVLSIGSSPFVLQVPPVIALVDDQLTNYFCASSQSNIFNNYDSYNENLEFHGYQLSIKCNYHKVNQPPPSTLQQEDNFESKNGFS